MCMFICCSDFMGNIERRLGNTKRTQSPKKWPQIDSFPSSLWKGGKWERTERRSRRAAPPPTNSEGAERWARRWPPKRRAQTKRKAEWTIVSEKRTDRSRRDRGRSRTGTECRGRWLLPPTGPAVPPLPLHCESTWRETQLHWWME